jgi:hypothetical protein
LDNAKEGLVSYNKKRFTKNVGIVFIEPLYGKRTKNVLNFDQLACAHLLRQMNRVQNLFDFQVITIQLFENFQLPAEHTKGLDELLNWLDSEVSKFENSKGKEYKIDYWFGITFCEG